MAFPNVTGSLAPLLLLVLAASAAAQADVERLAASLAKVSPDVAPSEERDQLRTMLGRKLRQQIVDANRASSEAWAGIKTLADWEAFRREKLNALKRGLGSLPPVGLRLRRAVVTREIQGERFKVANLVYQSRTGLSVT